MKIPLRQRVLGFLAETPILFLAIAVGIGLTFRVAMGWAKSEPAGEPSPVVHEQPAASAVRAPEPPAGVTEPTPTAPTAIPKRKLPRAHGRR